MTRWVTRSDLLVWREVIGNKAGEAESQVRTQWRFLWQHWVSVTLWSRAAMRSEEHFRKNILAAGAGLAWGGSGRPGQRWKQKGRWEEVRIWVWAGVLGGEMQTSWLDPFTPWCPCGAVYPPPLPTQGPHQLCLPNVLPTSVPDTRSLGLLVCLLGGIWDTFCKSLASLCPRLAWGFHFITFIFVSLAPSTCLAHRMCPVSATEWVEVAGLWVEVRGWARARLEEGRGDRSPTVPMLIVHFSKLPSCRVGVSPQHPEGPLGHTVCRRHRITNPQASSLGSLKSITKRCTPLHLLSWHLRFFIRSLNSYTDVTSTILISTGV